MVYVVMVTVMADLNDDNQMKEAQTVADADEIALLGKPKLGELYKCQIRIHESEEFKVIFSQSLSHIEIIDNR